MSRHADSVYGLVTFKIVLVAAVPFQEFAIDFAQRCWQVSRAVDELVRLPPKRRLFSSTLLAFISRRTYEPPSPPCIATEFLALKVIAVVR